MPQPNGAGFAGDDKDGVAQWGCSKSRDPQLDVIGHGTVWVEGTTDSNTFYEDEGAVCMDDYLHCEDMTSATDSDGQREHCDRSAYVEVSGDVVDLTVFGTYDITYTCTRTYGPDTHTTVKNRVVIVGDKNCAICAFDAEHEQTVTIEASFPFDAAHNAPLCTDDCGFTATVNDEGQHICHNSETKSASIVSNNVDVELTGVYQVEYSAQDLWSEGTHTRPTNAPFDWTCDTAAVTRTVTVIDSLQPVIGLKFEDQGTTHYVKHMSTDETDSAVTMAHSTYAASVALSTTNPANMWNQALMTQLSSVNGWMIAAAAAAVSGIALLAMGKKPATGLSELV
jgi:hypothetical protein